MAGSKEIRTKIKSVQSTRKITKAMEMVAASKMRKAQERMRHARPYGDKGRCGAMNTNTLRLALNKIRELEAEGRKVLLTAVGNKGFAFLQRFGGNIVSHVSALGDAPHMAR